MYNMNDPIERELAAIAAIHARIKEHLDATTVALENARAAILASTKK